MTSVPVSLYNNTCPNGRIRLPQISTNLSANNSGFTINQNKFTTNSWTDGDLCYDLCQNGDVPHLDSINGVYYCIAPASVDSNGNNTCMANDISSNNATSTSYTQTKLSDYTPNILHKTNNTWVSPFISSPGAKNSNLSICKRPVFGIASKQTLFDSDAIATSVMLDVLSGKQ
jgi:hypothetical protein